MADLKCFGFVIISPRRNRSCWLFLSRHSNALGQHSPVARQLLLLPCTKMGRKVVPCQHLGREVAFCWGRTGSFSCSAPPCHDCQHGVFSFLPFPTFLLDQIHFTFSICVFSASICCLAASSSVQTGSALASRS